MVKWTPENDQKLLIKILETSNVTADVKAIAGAWDPQCEAPTPRAVTERLVKIRSNCKATGGGHFSVTSAQSKGTRAPKTTTASPKTPKKTGPKSSTTTPASGSKRKRQVLSDSDDDIRTPNAQEPITIKDEPDASSPLHAHSTDHDNGSFNSYAPTLDDSDGAPATPSGNQSFARHNYNLPPFTTSPKRGKSNAGQPIVRGETMDMAQYANSQGYQNDSFMGTPASFHTSSFSGHSYPAASFPSFGQQEVEEEYEGPNEV